MKRKRKPISRFIHEHFDEIYETIKSKSNPIGRLTQLYGCKNARLILSDPILSIHIPKVELRAGRKSLDKQICEMNRLTNKSKKKKRKPKKKRDDSWRLRKAEYHEYLRSPEWEQNKAEAYQKYGRICDVCSSDVNLQVHHKTYAHIFHEYIDDLQILCRDCHLAMHRDLKKKKKNGS